MDRAEFQGGEQIDPRNCGLTQIAFLTDADRVVVQEGVVLMQTVSAAG